MELAAITVFKSSIIMNNLEVEQNDFAHPQSASKGFVNLSMSFAREEPITPWLGSDTANHYQWYPFINIGHYELAKQLKDKRRDTIIGYYKEGIQKVWNKAKSNAFLPRRSFYLVQQQSNDIICHPMLLVQAINR